MAVAKMKGNIAWLLSISSFLSCHAMAVILDMIETGIAPFDSHTQKTYHRTEHDVNRITRCKDVAIQNSTYHEGCIYDPILGKARSQGVGLSVVPFERAMAVSYMLSIMTIALSLTIRSLFSIEYQRRSNQQGVGHFGLTF